MRWLYPLMWVALTSVGGLGVAAEPPGPEAAQALAAKGDADAQYELGILYEFGFGLTNNRAPAHAWYSLAARSGHVLAAKRRDSLAAAMSSDELATARQLFDQHAAATTVPATVSDSAPESAPPATPTPN